MSRTMLTVPLLLLLLCGLLLPAPLAGASLPEAGRSPQALTPIYDIQYTTDPGDGTYPSPLAGQVITTTGVVYGLYGGHGFFIADAAGPWQAIFVYYPSGALPALGDLVQVQGRVQEYWGLTELGDYASYSVLSSGQPIYNPSLVTTAEVPFGNPDVSEAYESVLVEIHDITVTQAPDSYWIWTFSDAAGASSKADDWGYRADPAVGDTYALLRGALVYDYDEYKVMPRDDNDLVQGTHLSVNKLADLNVAPGALLTYTLSLQNNTLLALHDLVITDAVPISNAVVARVLDGGVLTGDTISWTLAALPVGAQAQVRFVVTATGQVGDLIVNRAYAAWAANWPDPARGGPLVSVIGGYTPIYMIQGDGFLSPLLGYPVQTQGIVVGFFEGNWPSGGGFDGFFIQDPYGDGLSSTADGVYVNHGYANVNVSVGDWVTVTGVVNECNEYDGGGCLGDACQTEILVDSAADVVVWGSGAITPTVLDPLGDPQAGRAYYESIEGMLVTLPETATVVGPTNYGTVMIVPGSLGVERVLRGGPYAGMPVGLRHWERYGEMPGDPPNLVVGSAVTGTHGPLAWSYGNYIVTTQPGAPWSAAYSKPVPDVPPTWPVAGPDEFTLISFNVENFFDPIDDPGKNDPIVSQQEYELKRDKIARSIAAANCPTVVGLQEVEKLEVIQDVATVLQSTYGCPYTATLIEGLDGRGIDVGYLTREDQLSIQGVSQYQDCTDYDTGLGQGDCPAGQQRLFSRIPLVLTATIPLDGGSAEVVLIVNHLKSKLSRSGDPESAQWRLLQAQSVATLTHRLISQDPDILLAVLGDLNDFEDSPPIEAFYETGLLTSTWYTLEPTARYSYIYQGVSQILDHVLLSPALRAWLKEFGALHYNADYPHLPYAEDPAVVWSTSDHDMPAITFRSPPDLSASSKGVDQPTPPPGAMLAYSIALSNSGSPASVALTDVLPAEIAVITSSLPAGLVYSDGLLLWSGALSTGAGLELAFQAQLAGGLADGHAFTNVVWIDDGAHPPFNRTAAARVVVPCDPVSGAGLDWEPATPLVDQVVTLTAWPDLGWLAEVVDGAGSVGQYASLALDALGRPHVSYYDEEATSLMYAYHDGTDWQLEAVSEDGVGQYSALGLNTAGQPHIAFYDQTHGALQYAHHDGAWHVQTVDGADDAGRWADLALDAAGHPYISYHAYGAGELRLAYHDGLTWTLQVVDSGALVGRYTSLALDAAGHPHVSYQDAFRGDLKYAYYDGAAWQIETVDEAGAVGSHSALALDDAGRPHISYLDGDAAALQYAHYDGSAWIVETAPGLGQAGSDTSLALDSAGRPHLATYDWLDDSLRYLYHDGSAWISMTVDAGAGHGPGAQASLALDGAGRPYLAYYQAANSDLVFAWLPAPPTPPLTYTWDLGDGTTAAGALVTHSYNLPGTYTLALTLSNPCGQVVLQRTLEVAAPLWKVYLPLLFK